MGIEKDVVRESGSWTVGKDGKKVRTLPKAQPPDPGTKKEKLEKGGDK